MFLQFFEQACIERAGVTGGDVLADVFRVAHADDCGTDGGVRQDEAQRHFWQGHASGDDFLEFVYALNCVGEIFRTEVTGAPIVFWETGFERHLAAEAAFVEGDAGNDADVEFLTKREEFIFGRLVEDVVDHLDDVD